METPPIEHSREPCPFRIFDDMGGAFAMGAIGGGVWHAVKGAKNSPIVSRIGYIHGSSPYRIDQIDKTHHT